MPRLALHSRDFAHFLTLNGIGFRLARGGRLGIVSRTSAETAQPEPAARRQGMSRTLTLTHAGWNAARAMARAGRRPEALAQLGRLLRRPDLRTPLAADA